MNFLIEKKRSDILSVLLTGLSRLEYRGYDSAGLAIDGDSEGELLTFKQVYCASDLLNIQVGKVIALREKVTQAADLDQEKTFVAHSGIIQ